MNRSKVYLVTSGDSRASASCVCWPAQLELEDRLTAAFAQEGYDLVPTFPFDPAKGLGFIVSQCKGIDVFRTIPPEAPPVFAATSWRYTHHIRFHKGLLLMATRWSGQWRGLVGLLNLKLKAPTFLNFGITSHLCGVGVSS